MASREVEGFIIYLTEIFELYFMEWFVHLAFAALAIMFLFNLLQVLRWGGVSRHLAYCFSLFVYFFYVGVTPAINFYTGVRSLYGIDYGDYFPEAMGVYVVGLAAFTFGYWSSVHLRPTRPYSKLLTHEDWRSPLVVLSVMFVLFAVATFFNLSTAGFDDWTVLFDFSNKTGGESGIVYLYSLTSPHPEFNYVKALTDTFIALLIMFLVYRMPRLWWWALVIVCGYFFLLSGWRYRIIMLMVGAAGYFWYNLRWRPQDYWKAVLVIVFCVLGVMLLTLNRMAIAKRIGSETTLDLRRFDEKLLTEQTINSQVFMLMLRYRDEHQMPLDWGRTMFLQTYYRAIPSRFFPDQKKPSPPLLEWQWAAQGTPEDGQPPRTGAITDWEEYYLSFGWAGLIVLAAMVGWLLGRLAHLPEGDFYLAWKLCCTAFMFQIITRGYLPQQVELFVYLMFPFALLRLISHYKLKEVFWYERKSK